MNKKPIYLLSPKISWKTFKDLQEKLVKDSGPTPASLDKVLWEMVKAKKIYCWFDDDCPDDMCLGFSLPKGREIKVISSFKIKRK